MDAKDLTSLKIEKHLGQWWVLDGGRVLVQREHNARGYCTDDEWRKIVKQASYSGPHASGVEAAQELLGMAMTERL